MEEAVERKGWVWLMREKGGLCGEKRIVVVRLFEINVRRFELEMLPWWFVALRAPFFPSFFFFFFFLLFVVYGWRIQQRNCFC